MVDRSQANMKVLKDTEVLQTKTKAAIERTQKVLNETEEVGVRAMEELQRNDDQLDNLDRTLSDVHAKQETTENLQRSFDYYTLNFGGSKAPLSVEAALRERDEIRNTKEVYQLENFDPITQHWKKFHIVSCLNSKLICDDNLHLNAGSELTGSWTVDFSVPNIDCDGWSYAFDQAQFAKTGTGEAKPKWNSYARRRKWRFEDSTNGVRNVFDGVVNRIEARKEQVAAAANTAFNSAKEGVNNATGSLTGNGYVPRAKHTNSLTASGLSSAGMIHHKDEGVLDAASASRLMGVEETNKEIDEGIEALDQSMNRISNMAGVMRDETINQNAKIGKIDDKMQGTGDKQALINAKLKYTIKNN